MGFLNGVARCIGHIISADPTGASACSTIAEKTEQLNNGTFGTNGALNNGTFDTNGTRAYQAFVPREPSELLNLGSDGILRIEELSLPHCLVSFGEPVLAT